MPLLSGQIRKYRGLRVSNTLLLTLGKAQSQQERSGKKGEIITSQAKMRQLQDKDCKEEVEGAKDNSLTWLDDLMSENFSDNNGRARDTLRKRNNTISSEAQRSERTCKYNTYG